MRVIRQATSLVTIILLWAGIAYPQKRCTNLPSSASVSDPAAIQLSGSQSAGSKEEEGQKLLIVADNQEHVVTGVQLFSMAFLSEVFISSTALRPPLAHVGGRLLFREALRFGKREGAGLVLHLGDATDISCRNELTSVFNVLDKEAPRDEKGDPMWFMAPGNHDGMLAGNLAGKQPGFEYRIGTDLKRNFYEKDTRKGLGHNEPSWVGACLSPPDLEKALREDPNAPRDSDMLKKGILTRGDAITLYVKELEKRKGFLKYKFRKGSSLKLPCREDSSKEDELGEETICIANTPIVCKVQIIEIKSQGYTAISRICPPTRVEGKAGDKDGKWVGPFASYIVQRLEVRGTPIILLDTTDYYNPTPFPVPLTGGLTVEQQKHADYLLSTSSARDSSGLVDRDKVIFAGHHPIDDLPPEQQRWIVERTSRYMSAHVHRSTQLVGHNMGKGRRALELNVGSTLDYPAQAVIAKLTPNAMSFRVVGADKEKTKWPGFLDECYRRTEWRLPPGRYKGYSRGISAKRLVETLSAAAGRAPASQTFIIPAAEQLKDWKTLNKALENINESEGEPAIFWACQAFYASEATKGEKSLLEGAKELIGKDTKSGCDATGEWLPFLPP